MRRRLARHRRRRSLLVLVLLALWQAAAKWDLLANALGIEPFLVPAPTEIAASLVDNSAPARRQRLGDPAGGARRLRRGAPDRRRLRPAPALSRLLRRAFYPLIVASQTVPIIVVAPILVVWFGFGIGPKVAIIALICFFPITVNTLDGLGSVEPAQRKMMRSLGAGRTQILTPARAAGRAPLPGQRREDRDRGRGDRRRVRRVGRLRPGARAPDARRQRPARGAAPVRGDLRALADGDALFGALGADRAAVRLVAASDAAG